MATKRIRGITLEIGGDTTGLDTALKQTDGSIRNLSNELREVEKSLKFNPGNMELLGQKSAILKAEISALTEKFKILKDAEEQVNRQHAEKKINDEQYRAFQREVEKAKNRIDDLSKSLSDNEQQINNGGQSFNDFLNNMRQAGDAALTFGDIVRANVVADFVTDNINRMTRAVGDFISEGTRMASEYSQNQTMLQQVMRNTMNATDDEINSLIGLAQAQANVGVVSKTAQVSAMAELASFVERKNSIEAMLPVMNDYIAYQYKATASAEQARNVATSLGKAVQGNIDGLAKQGFQLSEDEKKWVKTASEAERVAFVMDMVSESMDGVNEALAREMGGQAQLNAVLAETQMRIGEVVSDVKLNLKAEVLPAITELSEGLLTFVEDNREGIKNISNDLVNGFKFLLDHGDYLLGVIAGIGAGYASWKVIETVQGAVKAYQLFKTALDTAAVSQNVLNTATMAFPGMWIAGVLALVVTGVTAAVTATNRYQQSLEDARQGMLSAGESLRSVSGEAEAAVNKLADTDKVVQQWEALNEAIKSGKHPADELAEAKSQLAEAEEKLIELSGGMITQKDIEAGKTADQIKLVREQIETEKELAILRLEQTLRETNETQIQSEIDSLRDKKAELEKIVAAQREAYSSMGEIESKYNELSDNGTVGVERFNSSVNELRKQALETADAFGHDFVVNTKSFVDLTERAGVALKDTEDELAKVTEEILRGTNSLIERTNAEKTLADLNTSEIIKDISVSLGEETQAARAAREEAEQLSTALQTLEDDTTELYKGVKDARSGIDELDNAFTSLSNGQLLNASQLDTLIQKYPEVARYIADTGDITLKGGEIAKLTAAAHRDSVREILEARAEELRVLLQSAESALEITKQKYIKMAEAAKVYHGSMGVSAEDYSKKEQEAYDKLKDNLAGVEASLKTLEITASGSAKNTSKSIATVNKDLIESTRQAADDAMKAYDDLLLIGSADAEKLAQTAKEAAEEAMAAADACAKATGKSVQEATNAAKKAAEAAKDAIKEATKYADEYTKAQQKAFEAYGNAVTAGIKESYRRDYEAKETVIKDALNLVRNAQYDEVSITNDGSGEKLSILNREYIEKIRLIDDATAAALDGINAEIDAELEKLGITNASLARQIQSRRNAIAGINAEMDAERQANEEKRDNEKIAELEKRLYEAETAEDALAIQKQLDAYREEIEQRKRDNERRAAIQAYNEDIQRLQQKQQEEMRLAKESVEKKKKDQTELLSGKNGLASGLENGAFNGGEIADSLAAIKQQYEALVADAPKLAAGLVQSGIDGQQAALKILEKFYPSWRDAGKNFIDYYNEGVNDKADGMESNMLTVGTQAMDGFLDGMKRKEPEIIAETQRIFSKVKSIIQSMYEINSPSRVMMRLGMHVGEGFSTGIENAIPLIERASRKLGMAGIPDSGSNSGSRASYEPPAQQLISTGGISLHIENFNNTRGQDIQNLSEELGFYSRQLIAGVGGL